MIWCLFVPLSMSGQDHLLGPHTMVSAYAIDLKTGKVLIDIQGEKSLITGSCIKVVTTGAALHLLGPEYVFQTDLEVEGEVQRGILQGHLWIRGGGDPCLGSDRMSSSFPWDQQIEKWAEAVEKQGIKEIRGEVKADDSRWEKVHAVPSWSWEDVGNYYGAGASALSFHENSYSIYFSPGPQEGDETLLKRVIPSISYLNLHNEVKTGPVGSGDRACIYGSEFGTIQYIRGTIPAGVSEFSIKGSIPDPARVCSDLLCNALKKRGIQVRHEKITPSQKRALIDKTISPKVQDIIYWTNRRSVNLYAEHLLKSMGEKVYQDGSTQSGIKAVLEFWEKQGLDIQGMHMADGSGLSRKNFMTAQQFVFVLKKMKETPYFACFYDSLPEVQEGIRAKSGSMSFLRGYVGYKGDTAFAILINHCPDTPQMKQKLNQFLRDLP